MAKFILLNTVWVGSARRFAGDTIDTAQGDVVANIQAAGGVVVPFSDASATAAAAVVQSLRTRGYPPEYLEGMMIGALAGALRTNAVTASAFIDVSLNDLRIVDANNNVGAIAAIGGVLASNTAPVLAASSKALTVTWATGSAVPLSFHKAVPADLDPTGPCTLELTVASGTTDAATMGVQAIWDATAAASYSADDSATKSATAHRITATLLAADIPQTGPASLSVMITPPTHATNTIVLTALRLFYTKKLLTS